MRAVQAVAEVAEAGQDEFVRVQAAIHHRSIDNDIRIVLVDEREPFRGGNNAHEPDGACARFSKQVRLMHGALDGWRRYADGRDEPPPTRPPAR